jgi:hypothetical protein
VLLHVVAYVGTSAAGFGGTSKSRRAFEILTPNGAVTAGGNEVFPRGGWAAYWLRAAGEMRHQADIVSAVAVRCTPHTPLVQLAMTALVLTITLATTALLLPLGYPQGSCAAILNAAECSTQTLFFDPSTAYCGWSSAEGACVGLAPDNTASFLAGVVVAIASFALAQLINGLILYALEAMLSSAPPAAAGTSATGVMAGQVTAAPAEDRQMPIGAEPPLAAAEGRFQLARRVDAEAERALQLAMERRGRVARRAEELRSEIAELRSTAGGSAPSAAADAEGDRMATELAEALTTLRRLDHEWGLGPDGTPRAPTVWERWLGVGGSRSTTLRSRIRTDLCFASRLEGLLSPSVGGPSSSSSSSSSPAGVEPCQHQRQQQQADELSALAALDFVGEAERDALLRSREAEAAAAHTHAHAHMHTPHDDRDEAGEEMTPADRCLGWAIVALLASGAGGLIVRFILSATPLAVQKWAAASLASALLGPLLALPLSILYHHTLLPRAIYRALAQRLAHAPPTPDAWATPGPAFRCAHTPRCAHQRPSSDHAEQVIWVNFRVLPGSARR